MKEKTKDLSRIWLKGELGREREVEERETEGKVRDLKGEEGKERVRAGRERKETKGDERVRREGKIESLGRNVDSIRERWKGKGNGRKRKGREEDVIEELGREVEDS